MERDTALPTSIEMHTNVFYISYCVLFLQRANAFIFYAQVCGRMSMKLILFSYSVENVVELNLE